MDLFLAQYEVCVLASVGAILAPVFFGVLITICRKRVKAARASVDLELLPHHSGKPSAGGQAMVSFRGEGFLQDSAAGCLFFSGWGKAEIGADYLVIDVMGSRCEFARDEIVCIYPFSPFVAEGIFIVHNIPRYPKYVAFMGFQTGAMAGCLKAGGFTVKSLEEARADLAPKEEPGE